MSLDPSKLENARQCGQKIIARCPACAEQGHDQKGEHLVIMPDGRFGCVTSPGAPGKEHRQRIYALAGDKTTSRRGACMIRVRRPVLPKLPEIAAPPSKPGQVGTAGTPFSNPRATEAAGMNHDAKNEEAPMRKGEKETSQASHRVPTHDRRSAPGEADWCHPASEFKPPPPGLQSWADGPERAAYEAHLRARFKRDQEYLMTLPTYGPIPCNSPLSIQTETGSTDYADIDAETGHPIIDGAICPF
jgi:hypothetical protein